MMRLEFVLWDNNRTRWGENEVRIGRYQSLRVSVATSNMTKYIQIAGASFLIR